MTSTLASDALATASSDPPVTLSGLALARLLAGIQRRDQMAALSDLPPGDGLVRIP